MSVGVNYGCAFRNVTISAATLSGCSNRSTRPTPWITKSGTRSPAAHHSATGVAALAAKKALPAAGQLGKNVKMWLTRAGSVAGDSAKDRNDANRCDSGT